MLSFPQFNCAGKFVAYSFARESGTLRNFVVLTLVSGVVAAALSLVMFYLGSNYLSDSSGPTILSDQSLSGYIGIVIGAGVALGGSLVAIMLAERAVDSSNKQVDLTDRANRIAERQTPEAQLASEAAANYERLKGMLLTLPSLMRRAQRDGCFGPGGDRGILADLVGIVSGPSRALLESSVPATITNLASTLETRAAAKRGEGNYRVQRQHYFEYAFSSISYDLVFIGRLLDPQAEMSDDVPLQMHLQRLLHAIFSLVWEIDRLLKEADKEVQQLKGLGVSSSSDASTPAEIYQKGPGKFSQFEVSFIERVMPVVQLNTELWLHDDFRKLAEMSLKHLRNPNYSAATEITAENPIGPDGAVLLALHDSGHAEAMLEIERRAALIGVPHIVRLDEAAWEGIADEVDEKHVPIFWITEKAGDRLIQLQTYLKDKPGRWAKRIVVIEQIDLANDSSNTPSEKYLTLFEQITCWRAVRRINYLLDVLSAEEPAYVMETTLPSREHTVQALGRARAAFQRGTEGAWLQLPEGQWLINFVGPMFEHAATAIGSVPEEGPGFGLRWALQCNALLELMQADSEPQPDATTADEDGDAVHPLQFVSDCYPEFKATLEELSLAPLVDRPWYAFAGINQPSLRDLSFPDTSFYGVAYIGSRFTVGASPLGELLAQARPVKCLF